MNNNDDYTEAIKIFTDILLRLNSIENRLDDLEAAKLAEEDNWLNHLIDNVNSYKEKHK